MNTKYLAFDIEISTEIPEGETDWHAHRPLGISCAATWADDAAGAPLLWYGRTDNGSPSKRMNKQEVEGLVRYLLSAGEKYNILTWNGLGFDFDILAEESGLFDSCAHLANTHIDMMFHLFCLLGYPVGLDRAAKAMGLSGKPEGMSGALAPQMWAEGKHTKVLDYVAQDVCTTLDLAHVSEERGYLRWTSHSGKIRTVALPEGWLPVNKALTLPEPDTSWMSNPWPRSKFSGWTHQRRGGGE